METNVTTSSQYKLSKTLSTADSEPVRSITVIATRNENDKQSEDVYQLFTGSQNGILSIFDLSVNTNECLQMTPNDGSRPHSMTALLAIPENISFHYAAASRDGNIRLFSKDHILLKTLTGHEKPVTSLSWLCIGAKYQYLVSGSWDGTAKLWELNTGTCVATLPDHENTVTVMGLKYDSENFGKLVTASAGIAEGGMIKNHKIRIWDIQAITEFNLNCTLAHTPTDNHSGPIRGLSHDKNVAHMFASCSNDGTVKLRNVENGECTLTIAADEPGSFQPPILLDVMSHTASSETGPIVAIAAEDGALLLWSEENGSIQRIDHPGCVWKVMFLPNGDVCTACQDGFVRIFTCNSSRFADPMEIKALQESSNVNQRKASSGPSAEEIAKLPKWEMRSIQTGRSEGQIQVFSRDGKAIAAQWNDASRTWIEVGEVMGSNPNAGSINGENFDHVLPIEIDIPGGGVQKLQIGYNNGENPFVTAQQFIDDHMLDQNYLSQIADYIRQRVGDSAVTLGGNQTASSSTQSTATTPTFEMSPPPKQQRIFEHLPMKGYLKFDVPDMSKFITKISNKITELVSEKDGKVDLSLLPTLQNTLIATSRYHSSAIEVDQLIMMKNYINNLDIDALFPVLDLLRITVLHPDAGSIHKEKFWCQRKFSPIYHKHFFQFYSLIE